MFNNASSSTNHEVKLPDISLTLLGRKLCPFFLVLPACFGPASICQGPMADLSSEMCPLQGLLLLCHPCQACASSFSSAGASASFTLTMLHSGCEAQLICREGNHGEELPCKGHLVDSDVSCPIRITEILEL